MEIFFAGGPTNKIFIKFYEKTGRKVSILKNYYELNDSNFENTILSYKPYVDKIMLDSGAFSANNSLSAKEAEIIKKRYPFFLKQHTKFLCENIYRVFTYDFRFDAEGHHDNYFLYLNLRDNYKDICPVIHRYTENGLNTEIHEYSQYNPPAIAIGQIISENTGNNRTSPSNISQLQETINSIKQTNSDCHLLGITKPNALLNLQNYDTCDSTSWSYYARTGEVYIFWPPDNKCNKYLSRDFKIPQMLKHKDNKNSLYNKNNTAIRTRFFDEMKKELQLNEIDFNNSSSTESLQLANLYYSLKLMDYINSGFTQLDISTTTKQACQVNSTPVKNENPFANANNKNIQSNEFSSEINKFTGNPFK